MSDNELTPRAKLEGLLWKVAKQAVERYHWDEAFSETAGEHAWAAVREEFEDPCPALQELLDALPEDDETSGGFCPVHKRPCPWGCEMECYLEDAEWSEPPSQAKDRPPEGTRIVDLSEVLKA